MASPPETKNTVEVHEDLSGTIGKFLTKSKDIKWFNFTMLILIPLWAFLQTPWVPLLPRTLLWSVIYYFLTASSLTAGYHRLWAHHSYRASTPLKWLLAALGAGAVQGSIKFWVREHRAHHRYTDTDRDPYSISRGLLYAHILWAILKEPKKQNRVDISDIQNDKVVVWQHTYYLPIALFMGWLFPTLVAGLGWNDWYGGFLYTGIIRSFLVNQATFCVNSLAHWVGDQPYDDRRSPRNHIVVALITMGEGYHNFHHEFPSDYRNGVEWYQLDITKWIIWGLNILGLAYDLKQFKQDDIKKSQIQQSFKRLDEQRLSLDWGVPLEKLPVINWSDYQARVQSGQALLAVEGVVHDVSGFSQNHPGGEKMINSTLGQDATALFNGGIYNHSNAARNVLSTLRVAVLRGGGEVEAFKTTSL